MRQNLVIGASCCLLAIAWSCRDKDGVNPCEGVHPPTKDFKMYVKLDQPQRPNVVDTFRVPEDIKDFYIHPLAGSASNEVCFETNSTPADSVHWKIGEDARVFTQRKFSLKFLNPDGKIEVRLILYRKPNVTCFPNDDGIDTVSKTFYLKNGALEQPVVGRFKGYLVGNEQDTFTVVTHYFTEMAGVEGYYFIKNFPKGSTAITRGSYPYGKGDVISILGNKFGFRSDYGFGDIYNEGLEYGLGSVQKDSLIIHYKLTRNGGNGTFIGIRQK
jgi:hypothetical protein